MSTSPDITVIVSDGLAIHYGTDTQPVGTEAAGTSALVSRADHVHAHGNQTAASLHAIATSSANGFMSATDKAKIDTLTAGSAAVGNTAGEALDATTIAAAGTASTAARSDHTHSIAVAVIGDVQDVGVAATGSAPRFALADHSHAHGTQSDPTDHALADGSGAGFMSATEFTKLSGIAAGAIAATSTTPSAVGAAAVGVATTAARADHVHAHGNQLGGSLHAVADSSTAGFMSATDKSKLDALPSNPASVGSVTPSPIGSAAIGTATTAARSDHVHAHGNQAGGALHAAATESVAGFMTAADKTKLDNIDLATTVTDVAASGTVGVLTTYAPEDHAHAHGAQTDPTMHALADGSNAGFMSAAEFTKLAGVAASATATPLATVPPVNVTAGSAATGTGTHAAKDDHVHSVSTAAAVGLSPASTNAAGSADTLARSDHTHAIATAAAVVTIGTANAAGSAATFARGDHVHSHGAQTDGTLHAAVSTSVAGFMSAADKVKLNALVAGIDIQEVNTGNDAGTSTTWARSDHVHFHGHLPADGQMHAEVDGTDAGFAPALGGVTGYVLTDNGDGTSSWLAPTGSGGTPADGSVTTVKIVDGNVTSAKLADGSVTTVKLADANVTSAKIATGAVGSTQLASGSVIAAKIAAGAIGTTQLADANVTTAKLVDANVTTAKLADGSVTTIKLADVNVTTAKIADANITTAKIADANVTSAKIATGAVGAAQIANGGVGTTQLAANAVTAAKIANATVTSTQLAAAAVATANIADGAVTQAKLDSGVTLPLADNSVTTIKIVDANVTTGKLADGLLTEAKLATGLSVPVPSYILSGLPSPDGKSRLARLTDTNKGLMVSNGSNWTPAEGLQVYKPEDFGAIGDGSTDCANAFDAIVAAMPDTGGRIALAAGANYFLSRSWHITKPSIVEGCGNGFGPAASRFHLAAAASIVIDTTASSPFATQPGGGGSVLKNFLIVGTYPAVWQASHAYTVGQVVMTPKAWGGFTQLVYVCTGAGTSDSAAPAFTLRDDALGYNTEGVTFTDGGVTWKAVSSPGIWFKNKCLIDDVYILQCPGDGIYGYGYISIAPSTGCSTFQIHNCSQQLNLGRGIYIEGSDANGGHISGNLAQNNWSGGYFDNSDIGNLWSADLTEANGVGVWSTGNTFTNFNQLGTGAAVVPSTNAMDAMQTAVGNVYYYTGTGSGTTGGSEPVWPTTIGNTVSDSGITWTCAGIYRYGEANKTGRTGLNAAAFIGCYQEPDQRFNDLSGSNVWIGNIGGFFRASSGCWIQQPGKSSAYKYLSPPGSPHAIQASVGDPSLINDVAFTWNTFDSSVAANNYALSITSDLKYWSFDPQNSFGNGSLRLSNAGAAEGVGKVVIKGDHGLFLSGVTGGARAWSFTPLGLDTTGAPPDGVLANTQLGDLVIQTYQNATGAYPDGWFCTTAGGSPVYTEFSFDKKRKVLNVTDTVGSPRIIATSAGTKLRNQVYSNAGSGVLSCATLPIASAETDFKFHFVNEPGGLGWRINANTGKKISVGGVTSSTGGYIQCATPGAWVTLESCGTSDPVWIATAAFGDWVSDVQVAPAGIERLVASTVVDLSLSTKQTLYTVPSGQHLVITKINSRSPTATLTTGSGGVGYDAGASNVTAGDTLMPTTTTTYGLFVPAVANPVGAPADVLGFKTSATQAATSMTVDVFGYFF